MRVVPFRLRLLLPAIVLLAGLGPLPSVPQDLQPIAAALAIAASVIALALGRQPHAAAAAAADDEVTVRLARAAGRARQASAATERSLAVLGHELRTPLNGLLGHARLLHDEGGLNAAQCAHVEAMLAAGDHLRGVTAAVLDGVRVQAADGVLRAAGFDLRRTAEGCLELLRPVAAAKGLALSIHAALGLSTWLVTDEGRVRQVLLNLLGNAIKFTAAGRVELRLCAAGGNLRVEVADTGPGIPEPGRARLFTRFERLGAEAAGTEGTGLGLAISAGLVERMGGRIGHADNPDGGSIFWFDLPAGEAAAAMPAVATPFAAAVVPPRSVLVVDDVAMNREVAGGFLRAAGHDATCVATGEEAVAAVATGAFDVVLMDVRMPGMDGLEATSRIRALPGARGRVPVLAVSGDVSDKQVAAFHRAGMDGHIAKPLVPEDLLAAVGGARNRLPPALVPPASEADAAAVLDRAAFARTASVIEPAALGGFLEGLAEHIDGVLRQLRDPAAPAELADAAHALAGGAGTLGFRPLCEAARGLERALRDGSRSSAPAGVLAAAGEAALREIKTLRRVRQYA